MIDKKWRSQFSSAEEMNELIVRNWNDAVHSSDQVWVLGDVVMGNTRANLPIMSRLKGEKHLIAGNHDAVWSQHRDSYKHFPEWLKYFNSIQSFARKRIKGKNVLLSHFPYQGDHRDEERFTQYRLRDEGLPLLHGHVHTEWRERGYQFNVGVDVRDFRPVSLQEIERWVESLGV